MRYPLVAFLFVFLLGPYTAHALLTGSARIQGKTEFKTSRGSHPANDVFESRRVGGGVLVSAPASITLLGD